MSLTWESDRPFAVAGIVRRVQERTGDAYLGGLWLEDLPRGLLWDGFPRIARKERRKPEIPSWSWMSRVMQGGDGAFAWNDCTTEFRPDPRLRIDLEGTLCLTKTDNRFGEIVGG